jgi:seryl-tRNA synthetase
VSSPERVVALLRERGELWEVAPGLIGLRGAPLALFHDLENSIGQLARSVGAEEWRLPCGLPLETLARAEYFASFPQWLTVASHLTDDDATLERIASDPSPAESARSALAPAGTALPPALCYHTYSALAGRMIVAGAPAVMTAQGTCWRHEGARLLPLERGWAFTMREIVCVGDARDVESFRQRGMRRVAALAEALSLHVELAVASDPFFAPTARGKALLQRVKALKHELLLPIGSGRAIAASSFNNHETFFGEAFDIRLADGSPASSACVAFGLERWLLAVLARHGSDPQAWPELAWDALFTVEA